MKVSTSRLTPRMAQKYLDTRASNRPLDERYATRLAGAIQAGKWELNGESIKINDKGQMEDGQHRCLAVVLAGVPINTVFVTGLPSENGLFETIDIGKKRTIAHMFGRGGEKYYTTLAAAVAWLWRWHNGQMVAFNAPRHDEASAVLKEHPGLRNSCESIQCCRKVMTPGLAAFLHYLFAEHNVQSANKFFTLIGSGEGLAQSSPETSGIYRLREMLLEDKSKRVHRHNYVVAAMTIKAWNAVRSRRVVSKSRISWEVGDEFPVVE